MGPLLSREWLSRPSWEVAPDLLGCELRVTGQDGRTVGIRLTEVEAYDGATDPASHAFGGMTKRNAAMFGSAGHLYLYLIYGMHWCANIVTGPDGHGQGVLMRGGEVVTGTETAAERRSLPPGDPRTARGPAGLVTSLGIVPDDYGSDLLSGRFALLRGTVPGEIVAGPRVGIRKAADLPWRFFVPGAPGVTTYRPAAPRRKRETRS